jgi:DNA polymerase-3 subunit gamma/tau
LKYVARDRGVDVEEMALNVIAQKADGAMRDALSIFDQVMSFCGNKITYDGVIANLNVLDYDYYFRLVDALLQNRVAEALMVFDEVLSKGFEGQHFVGGLSSHLRDLMVSKDVITLPLLEVGAAIAERYKEQAQRCDILWLYKALEYANDCDLAYRASKNKRLLVEVMLIRVAGLVGGLQSKKVEPELPLIDVASTPGGQIKATEQQAVVNRPIVVGQRVSQPNVPVATGPVVVQRPTTVNVSLPMGKETTKEKPKVVVEKTPEAEIENIPADNNVIVERVSLDVLIKTWRVYAKKIEGELYTSKAMMNCLPCEIDGEYVVVKLINQMQYDDLIKHKQSIERFLCNELQNSSIKLKFVIDENIAQTAILTQDERYKHMLEINSGFRTLKTELGLDLV